MHERLKTEITGVKGESVKLEAAREQMEQQVKGRVCNDGLLHNTYLERPPVRL